MRVVVCAVDGVWRGTRYLRGNILLSGSTRVLIEILATGADSRHTGLLWAEVSWVATVLGTRCGLLSKKKTGEKGGK